MTVEDKVVAQALRTQACVGIGDAKNNVLANQARLRQSRLEAILVAPLYDYRGLPCGILTIEYETAQQPFSDRDQQIMLGLAQLVETVLGKPT